MGRKRSQKAIQHWTSQLNANWEWNRPILKPCPDPQHLHKTYFEQTLCRAKKELTKDAFAEALLKHEVYKETGIRWKFGEEL